MESINHLLLRCNSIRFILFMVYLSISINTYSFTFGYLSIENSSEKFYYNISPTITTGTHVNGLGMNLSLCRRFPRALGDSIVSPNFGVYMTPVIYLSNLGVPDESIQMNIGTDLSLSWGHKVDIGFNDSYYREISRHNFRYYLNYYFSSDGTSQPYGGIQYTLSLKHNDIVLSLDNDDAYFIATDKYRTTKGEITYIRYTPRDMFGISLGFLLWTGNLDGTASETAVEMRDNSYELSGYGGDYSHGIAELTFIFNKIHLSIGYDSEDIRDIIQNGWHNFYNRPRVPLVDRENRFYLQFSLNPPRYQY